MIISNFQFPQWLKWWICLQCKRLRRHKLSPWAGKRKSQPSSVFLPRKSHGLRSLVGYSPQGHKELNSAEHARIHLKFQERFHSSLAILTFLVLPSMKLRTEEFVYNTYPEVLLWNTCSHLNKQTKHSKTPKVQEKPQEYVCAPRLLSNFLISSLSLGLLGLARRGYKLVSSHGFCFSLIAKEYYEQEACLVT